MDCLCLNTRRAARALTRIYEAELREVNLTPAQFGLLSVLAKRPGISQIELAEMVDLDQTTLSRSMKSLVASRWLTVKQCREDRRQTGYWLSAAGLKVHQAALPHWQRVQQKMRRQLGEEWETTLAMLKRIQQVTA